MRTIEKLIAPPPPLPGTVTTDSRGAAKENS